MIVLTLESPEEVEAALSLVARSATKEDGVPSASTLPLPPLASTVSPDTMQFEIEVKPGCTASFLRELAESKNIKIVNKTLNIK